MRGDPTAVTRHLGQPVQIIAALGSFVGNKITIGDDWRSFLCEVLCFSLPITQFGRVPQFSQVFR